MSNVPEWLTEALKNRKLSVLKSQGPVSSDASEYIMVAPLDEMIRIQNIIASLCLAEMEGELNKVDWNIIGGVANRLAHFIEEPVHIKFDDWK